MPIPMRGDRGARDVLNYEDEHANDIDAATLRRHTPLPGAAGGLIQSDGADWQRVNSISVALADLDDYARGSVIRGGAADWEAHAAETNHFILVGDGVDITSKAFDWDDMAAGAGADMVHDHSVAGEGGEIPLASLGGYTQGDLIYGGGADWQDLAHPGAANRVLQSTAAEVGWSASAVTFPAAGAAVVGTGGANQVAYWAGANTITGDAGMTYNAGTDSLTAGNYYVPDGGTIGIIGNELLTFNAAGTAVFSGCDVGIGGAPAYTLDVTGNFRATTGARIYNTDISDIAIELNTAGAGNRFAFIDFHGDDTYVDFGLRIIRGNSGANTNSSIFHRGTGNLVVQTQDAGSNIILAPAASIGIGTLTFGANAVTVLGIANGTQPTTSPVDMIQLFSMDIGGGGASLGVRTEETVTAGAPTLSHKIKIKWNGVEYWLGLDAV